MAPRLWVGAAPDVVDLDAGASYCSAMARLGIGLVVDCRAGADDLTLWRRIPHMRYVNIGVEDAGAPLPGEFFTEGVELVMTHWYRTTSGVLLHCESGAHRSPALALAVLLVDGATVASATRRLATARPVVRDRYFLNAISWHATYTGVV